MVKVSESTLSVIVITCNEAQRIQACLESVVELADEIIVFDSGSQDQTVQIARQFTPHVIETDWPGFGPQKQRALERSTGRWVLSLDADETLSPELCEEIRAAISHEQSTGYLLPRLTRVCGKPVRHSGWYPDYLLRLARRDLAYFTPDIVHERMCLKTGDSSFHKLHHPIIHDSYDSLDQLVSKMNLYSTMGAEKLERSKVKGGLFKALVKGFAAFVRSYVLKRGFLDGGLGVVIAISSAESAYYKYLKLSYDYGARQS